MHIKVGERYDFDDTGLGRYREKRHSPNENTSNRRRVVEKEGKVEVYDQFSRALGRADDR